MRGGERKKLRGEAFGPLENVANGKQTQKRGTEPRRNLKWLEGIQEKREIGKLGTVEEQKGKKKKKKWEKHKR